jgi:hypothetical protein
MTSPRVATAAFVLVIILVVAIEGVENYNLQSNTLTSTSTSSTTITVTNSAPSVSVDEYGPVITIDAARQLLSYNFSLPTNLPDGLQLKEILGGENLINLIFSSPTLPAIQPLGGGSMLVTIARDNTTYTDINSTSTMTQYCSTMAESSMMQECMTVTSSEVTIQSVPSRTNVSVANYSGWGNDSMPAVGQNGFLTWWDTDNGLHYAITADLPLPALLSIGDAMMAEAGP